MGDKPVDGEKSQPSLELPSLFGGRKKSRLRRQAAREAGPEAGGEAGRAATDVEASPPSVRTEPVTYEAPSVDAPRVEARSAEAEPVGAEPAGADPAGAERVAAEPAAAERVEPGAAATAPTERAPAEPAADQGALPERAPAEAEPLGSREAAPEAGETESAEPAATEAARAERAPARRARTRRALPAVSGRVTAPITGVLVGLFGAGLTYASLGACDAIRGTTSCGGPGVFVLVAIVVLMIVFGALLLRVFKVPDPRSTSFLAVGVTVVVVLVALMQALFSSWMFLVVPLISAVAYSVAHWVTTRYVELPDDGPQHDIR